MIRYTLVREFRINSLVFESRLEFIVTPGSRTVEIYSETTADGVAEKLDITEARKTWAHYLSLKAGRTAGGFVTEWRQLPPVKFDLTGLLPHQAAAAQQLLISL